MPLNAANLSAEATPAGTAEELKEGCIVLYEPERRERRVTSWFVCLFARLCLFIQLCNCLAISLIADVFVLRAEQAHCRGVKTRAACWICKRLGWFAVLQTFALAKPHEIGQDVQNWICGTNLLYVS